MLENFIRCLVVGIVLYVVYYLVTLLVAALGLPAVFTLIALVILILVFCAYLLRAFNIHI